MLKSSFAAILASTLTFHTVLAGTIREVTTIRGAEPTYLEGTIKPQDRNVVIVHNVQAGEILKVYFRAGGDYFEVSKPGFIVNGASDTDLKIIATPLAENSRVFSRIALETGDYLVVLGSSNSSGIRYTLGIDVINTKISQHASSPDLPGGDTFTKSDASDTRLAMLDRTFGRCDSQRDAENMFSKAAGAVAASRRFAAKTEDRACIAKAKLADKALDRTVDNQALLQKMRPGLPLNLADREMLCGMYRQVIEVVGNCR